MAPAQGCCDGPVGVSPAMWCPALASADVGGALGALLTGGVEQSHWGSQPFWGGPGTLGCYSLGGDRAPGAALPGLGPRLEAQHMPWCTGHAVPGLGQRPWG